MWFLEADECRVVWGLGILSWLGGVGLHPNKWHQVETVLIRTNKQFASCEGISL